MNTLCLLAGYLLTAALGVSFPACAQAAASADPLPSSEITALESTIEHAYLRGDAALLSPAITSLEARLKTEPADPAARYLRGFAAYAEGCFARVRNDQTAFIEKLERADQELAQVKGAPWEAEAAGLQSYLFGQLIGAKGTEAAMSLGPKSGRLLQKAVAAAPHSPRILFFQGISLLNTPEMWGGDPVKGVQALEKAVAGFAKVQPSAVLHWGQPEALAWAGIEAKKAHKLEVARQAWQKALELEPNYLWVKDVLLPSLDQAPRKPRS